MCSRSSDAITLTDAVSLAEPPAPAQINVYEASALRGPTDSDPDLAFVPDHPPDAVHDVAFAEDQASVSDEPETIDEALDVNVTVGAGAALLPESPPPPPQAASQTVASIPRLDRIKTRLCITSP
jgi:hypothetical protein